VAGGRAGAGVVAAAGDLASTGHRGGGGAGRQLAEGEDRQGGRDQDGDPLHAITVASSGSAGLSNRYSFAPVRATQVLP
jgi:hypothetical protein